MFRALLLAIWQALDERASFRRFYGFSATEPTPERTAFVRFRAELVGRALGRLLVETITERAEAKGVAARTRTLVETTLIATASIRHDDQARWAGHRSRKPVHGYKPRVATHAGGALIRGVEVTTANVHDDAKLEAVLPPDRWDVYGNSAFAGSRSERVIIARCGTPRAVQTGIWGGPRRSPA